MGYRNAEETRRNLILAAESLVAVHGLAGVSAREIARQSGMKNNVVVQYHFQTIDHLFDAIVMFRMAQLEGIRRNQAKTISSSDLERLSLDQLMALVCLPHLDLRDGDGRYPYAVFLCHYLPERRPLGFEWVMEAGESITPLMQKIVRLIRQKLPDLPDMIFNRRMTNATLVFLNVLRGISNEQQAFSDLSHHPLIIDGMRQSVSVLNTVWVDIAVDR